MIKIHRQIDSVSTAQLQGPFFEGWPNPPNPETHLKILQGSHIAFVAESEESGQIVGFVNAVSDGVLTAYIPLLEVLANFRGQGLGRKLMNAIMQELEQYYMIDVVCDPNLKGFYESLGLQENLSMIKRNYSRQSGAF